MPRRRSPGWRLGAVAVSVLCALGALTACTSSAPEGAAVWSAPSEGDTSVAKAVIGVPGAVALPKGFLDELAIATTLTLTQVSVDLAPGGVIPEAAETSIEDIDVLMGFGFTWLDPTLADSPKVDTVDLVDLSFITYGNDDACILVDASWFSANNMALPETAVDLPAGALEMIVASANPTVSPYALALLPQWDGLWQTWAQTAQSADAPQSSDGGEVGLVGMVGSALEPIRNLNNLGTDTRYRVLEDTCVEREVALVDLSARPGQARDDAAYVVLADFLGGEAGAELLAKYGVAYRPGAALDGQSEPGLKLSDAKPAFPIKEVPAALNQWEKTFG